MNLHVKNEIFPVAQSAGDFLILKNPARIECGPAKFFLKIDDDEEEIAMRIVAPVDGRRVELGDPYEHESQASLKVAE